MANIDWTGFIVASIAIVLAPGPGSLFVARSAAASGLRAGHDAMLGIMVGDTFLIMLSALGVSALFHAYPSLFHTVRLVGAGYLVFLGLRLALRKPGIESACFRGHGRPFVEAIAITLLNPKAVFFFMAFFPMFVNSPENAFLAYAVMTLAFQAISAAYLCLLIRASSWTASALRGSSAARRILEKLCGCVFIGFGVKAAMARR